MTIKQKLVWGFIGIGMIVCIVCGFSFLLSEQIWGLRITELPMVKNLRGVEEGIWELIHAANAFKLSGNDLYKELYDESIVETEGCFKRYCSLIDTETERQYVEEFRVLWDTAKQSANRMIELAEIQKATEDKLFVSVDEADDVLDFELQGKWQSSDPYILQKERAVREVEVSIWEAIGAAQQFTGLSGNIVRGKQEYVGNSRHAAERGAIASLVKGDFAELMERQFDDVEEYWQKYKSLPLEDFEKDAIAVFEKYWNQAVEAGREVVAVQKQNEEQFNVLFNTIERADKLIDRKMQAFVQTRIDNENKKAKMLTNEAFSISAATILIAAVIGMVTSRSICRPIAQLDEAVNKIKNGQLDVSIENKSNDEIGRLMTSFKDMAIQLDMSIGRLKNEINNRKEKEKELKEMQTDLAEASFQAGKAEMATDVLHNVGNVLNSINVSVSLINSKTRESKLSNLEKVALMVQEHINDLCSFFTEDAKGKLIPGYLSEVTKIMVKEQQEILDKLKHLIDDLGHVKSIISMQQNYGKSSSTEIVSTVDEIIEDAIRINSSGLEKRRIRIVRDFQDIGQVTIDKQKAIQIFVNLIGNAKDALESNDESDRVITVRSYKPDDEHIRVEVIDNGSGISKENLENLFKHGFTTKETGHGFGLHSGVIAAKEMSGSLTAYSDGAGCGAKFVLEIPFKPANVMQNA